MSIVRIFSLKTLKIYSSGPDTSSTLLAVLQFDYEVCHILQHAFDLAFVLTAVTIHRWSFFG